MTLTASQARAVAQVSDQCQGYRTVIVGASALGFYYDMTWRKTADVDLAIALEIDDFPLGIDIGTIAHDKHKTIIDKFLERVGDEESVDHAQMNRRGPHLWALDKRALAKRLEALLEGVETGMREQEQ